MQRSQLHTLYVLHPLITPSKVGLITTSHRGEAAAPKYEAPCLSHAAQEFRKLRRRPGPQPRPCSPPDEATVLSPPCPWSPCMPGSFLPHCSSSVFSPCAHHLTTSAQASKPYLLREAALSPTTLPPTGQNQPLPWMCFKGMLSLPTREHNLPVSEPVALPSAP